MRNAEGGGEILWVNDTDEGLISCRRHYDFAQQCNREGSKRMRYGMKSSMKIIRGRSIGSQWKIEYHARTYRACSPPPSLSLHAVTYRETAVHSKISSKHTVTPSSQTPQISSCPLQTSVATAGVPVLSRLSAFRVGLMFLDRLHLGVDPYRL